jgi:hypothetical protein
MMPPATALPTSTAPAMIIGATFASGEEAVENEVVEESIWLLVVYLIYA